MRKIHYDQVQDRIEFIQKYTGSNNPATCSEVDANANVTNKSLATLEAELYKPYTIAINRELICRKLKDLYGDKPDNPWAEAIDYVRDLENHIIYVHDESSLKPYCASITLYPFLLEGTKCLGGVSKAPQNLQSFCGSFVNLVYQVASDFAGAIATVEFLHIFDYFARKDYGEHYLATNEKDIRQAFQGVVYALNQPASARGNQSIFFNISVLDKYYLKQLFGHFTYPDGTKPNFKTVMKLQKYFMEWFREERKKELLTFPVLTASLLTNAEGFADEEFRNYCAKEMSLGHSFFVYMSDSVDSLASCCRLRNALADNTFSYSLGAGGVVTGSAQVITLNMNRFVQQHDRIYTNKYKTIDDILPDLRVQINHIHKYLYAHQQLYKEYIEAGLLPSYTAGFMDISKQFLTIGVNGLIEALEYFGYDIKNTKEVKQAIHKILGVFKEMNEKARETYGTRFNTELVPAENLGVKNAKWDKEDGYKVPRDCYNSYFYKVEDQDITILDKFSLYGEETTSALDGGSALHLNIEQLLDYPQAIKLFDLARKYKVPYWTYNCLCTICNTCGHIDPQTHKACPKCQSEDIDYGTRVIGYLKRVTNFSKARQEEHQKRYYVKP